MHHRQPSSALRVAQQSSLQSGGLQFGSNPELCKQRAGLGAAGCAFQVDSCPGDTLLLVWEAVCLEFGEPRPAGQCHLGYRVCLCVAVCLPCMSQRLSGAEHGPS
jgi:hypothetical protein